ncbi:MAG: hypothetical protein WA979_13225 [Pacificimonas sp.]
MSRNITLGLAFMLGLSACKPTSADIELMLGARGMNSAQAACIGDGLQVLTEDDWRTLAGLAADFGKSEEEWKQFTLADLQAKLFQLKDERLMGTLLRTGLGCAVMHAEPGEGLMPRAVPPVADDGYMPPDIESPEDDDWLDQRPI